MKNSSQNDSDQVNNTQGDFTRREFVTTAAAAVAGMMVSPQMFAAPGQSSEKKRLALVGTGIRGTKFFGEFVQQNYSDVAKFVGLCDINLGRVKFAREAMGVPDCPVFTNCDEMLDTVDIDLLMVVTVDNTHDEFIIKALNRNIDVVTEKPMTTDETKCQAIIDAARNSNARLIMGFNYRYGSIFSKLKEMLLEDRVGEITSIDFNWYLNTHHGASYFRRWHGLREKGGTLLLHKSAHHFDLLNWWIGSDPVEVHAYGGLDHYGHNNSFRSKRCMGCQYKDRCKFHWDMSKDDYLMKMYHANEKYDGYIRDNCLWREEIDIFDKMAVQIKYANGVQVSYSLTTYSPYEGFRLAFNGMNGRIETWEGVPSMMKEQEDQALIYKKEMDQSLHAEAELQYHEIITQDNFEQFSLIKHPFVRKAHWGGDPLMMDQILRGRKFDEKLNLVANFRDGSMAVLVGIAARKSIDEGRAVKIAELTDLKPQINKWAV